MLVIVIDIFVIDTNYKFHAVLATQACRILHAEGCQLLPKSFEILVFLKVNEDLV